jgi:hypothetical protein
VLLFCNVVATVYCKVDKGSFRILCDKNPGKGFFSPLSLFKDGLSSAQVERLGA